MDETDDDFNGVVAYTLHAFVVVYNNTKRTHFGGSNHLFSMMIKKKRSIKEQPSFG